MRMNWTYPLAEHVDFSYECAGNYLTDNYAWMEKNDEKTKRYVAEQNLFTTLWFEGTSDVSRWKPRSMGATAALFKSHSRG